MFHSYLFFFEKMQVFVLTLGKLVFAMWGSFLKQLFTLFATPSFTYAWVSELFGVLALMFFWVILSAIPLLLVLAFIKDTVLRGLNRQDYMDILAQVYISVITLFCLAAVLVLCLYGFSFERIAVILFVFFILFTPMIFIKKDQ